MVFHGCLVSWLFLLASNLIAVNVAYSAFSCLLPLTVFLARKSEGSMFVAVVAAVVAAVVGIFAIDLFFLLILSSVATSAVLLLFSIISLCLLFVLVVSF